MTSAGLLDAFLGGVLTLVSPCSAMLLPSFFAYSFTTTGRLLRRTAVFYLGLATTLVPLGVAGSYASRLFYGHHDLLVTVGGWTVIALGVAQIAGTGFGSTAAARAAGRLRGVTALSVYLLGTVYGLAGFCAGPILGSVLTVSAMDGRPTAGAVLLAAYALGMCVPLFAVAALWDRLPSVRHRLRGRTVRLGRIELHTNSLLAEALFITLGAVFLRFDGTSALPGIVGDVGQLRLEERVESFTDALPSAPVALTAAAVLLLIAWRLVRWPRRDGAPDARQSPDTQDTAVDDGAGGPAKTSPRHSGR